MRFLGKAGAVTMALVMVMMTQSIPSWGRTTSVAGRGPTEKCLDYGSGPRRSVLRGNVNNDRRRDEIFVTARKRFGKCRVLLVVDTGKRNHRKRLRGDRFIRSTIRTYPPVLALLGIDLHEGREIVVRLDQGASVGVAGMFTMRDGRIKKVLVRRKSDANHLIGRPNLLPYYGSFGGMYAVDCARDHPKGTIVKSEAVPKNYNSQRRTWIVTRRWFEIHGRVFQRTAEPVERRQVRLGRVADRFEEFDGFLFPHCPGRVASKRF